MTRNSKPPLDCSISGCPVWPVREPCDTDVGQRWRWGSSCFRGQGTPLEWSRSLGPVGPAWSSQGHICGPPPPPPPGHVCPLGPGLAFLIPQPCRSSLFFFFNVPSPEHSVSPFDLSQDWAQSPVGGGWPQKFCHLSSLCWSWAFLRGCPQEHFLPPALGLLPRASQLHSQVSGSR